LVLLESVAFLACKDCVVSPELLVHKVYQEKMDFRVFRVNEDLLVNLDRQELLGLPE